MRVRTDSRREEILDVASEVFIELGFEAATMSEVAARLGGSKTTLYGYFPSKEALFLGVIQHKMGGRIDPVLNALAEKLGDEPRDVLIELGQRLNEMTTRPDAAALSQIVMSQMGQPELAMQFWDTGPRRLYEAVEHYLRGLGAAGRLIVPQPKVATQHLLALYHAEIGPPFHSNNLRPPTRRGILSAVTRAVDVFLRAYGCSR